MMELHDLVLTHADAHALAAMLDGQRRGYAPDADPAQALVQLLAQARRVPQGALPADRVATGCGVTYVDEHGAARSVTLVYPADADLALKRISVLSPIGRALIGRRRGERVEVALPGGRRMGIHIVAVRHERARLREAA